jgi:hypothetical protein
LNAARRLGEPEFETSAERIADIFEESDIGLGTPGGLEQDVVFIDDVESAGVPSQTVCRRAIGADFTTGRDHLIERRTARNAFGKLRGAPLAQASSTGVGARADCATFAKLAADSAQRDLAPG